MARAQDGDAGAYRKLLHDITPLLRRVAARRLDHAPAADVEDVVIAPEPSSDQDGCRNTSGSLDKAGATKMTHDTITTAGIDTAKATLDIAVHGRPERWQFGTLAVRIGGVRLRGRRLRSLAAALARHQRQPGVN